MSEPQELPLCGRCKAPAPYSLYPPPGRTGRTLHACFAHERAAYAKWREMYP